MKKRTDRNPPRLHLLIAGISTFFFLFSPPGESAERVKLFPEPDGSPGKLHPLSPEDMGLHPSDSFFYTESYFLIALTEEGYYGYVSFVISNMGVSKMKPAVSFTIVTPERRRLSRDLDFSPRDLKTGKKRFSLELPGNYLRETDYGFKLRVFDRDLGMELDFKNQVPGFVVGEGKAWFGDEHFFYINYPAPRPAVAGRFIVEGKSIPVRGWGYMDHSLTVTNPAEFEEVWHNLKFHSDNYTLLVSSFTTPEEYDRDFGIAVLTDTEKVLCLFTDVKVSESKVSRDEDSGKPYPGRLSFELSSPSCRVSAGIDVSRPVEKFDVLAKLEQKWWGRAAKLAINAFIARPWYFRAVEPVELEVEMSGRKFKVEGQAFSEVIFTK